MQDIQDFPEEFRDFRVTDLRKLVIKPVMSDGKVYQPHCWQSLFDGLIHAQL